MSTTTGQPTNAVFGFTSMLINLLRDEEPTHIGVCLRRLPQDLPHARQYAEYKAGRSATPDDFRGQVELIRRCSTRCASATSPSRATRPTT